MIPDAQGDALPDVPDTSQDVPQDMPDAREDLDVGDPCSSPVECGQDKQCVRQGAGFVCMRTCAQAYRRCEDGSICTPISSGSINVCYLGGQTPAGAACTQNMECVTGHRCVGTSEERYCYESCGPEDACGAQEACYLTNPNRGICTSPVGVPCSELRPCQQGLSCTDTLPAEAQQAWPQPVCTRACQQDDECPEGALCKELVDGQRQCVSACEQDRDCVFGAGMVCRDASQACGARPEDAPCRQRFGADTLCVHQEASLSAP